MSCDKPCILNRAYLNGDDNRNMAIKATICKAKLQIADMDRGYYNDLSLTIAQHPSETDERMMVRLLAFALPESVNNIGTHPDRI